MDGLWPPVLERHMEAGTMDIGTTDSLQYDFSIVKAATNNFSEENKLGRGGFGTVYKAWKSWRNGTTSDIIDPTLKTRSGSLHDIIRRYNSFTRSDGLRSSEYSVNEVSISDFVPR
ncbi:hypothetical protein L1987_47016 [Smallanthus sonchifolius]|uniref:Uncharacterized protein n=1 Tax=Smallanthus sonchifolius TaxID=185202 RepID=A0ACB9G0R3_9ASTR|nr:hypothetical protein L1987_47016 [Smallanthus sonchifolius]